jgi:EAL domain-containing protein (putative c-di-GMP-specific phosphodiesterase class I)
MLSGIIHIFTGHMKWHRGSTFHLISPFHGIFGDWTSLMAGLYLLGFAAPAFEAAACHVGDDYSAWRAAGARARVVVNLSTRNHHDPGLVDTIGWMTRKTGVAAASLTVEITESALMVKPEAALEVPNEIHELGVRIAIDDFGTGYSSLAYLERLPVDEIKIDQSFIQRMTRNGTVIARSVIDLGNNLGIEVTAEGIEDQGAWETLQAMGCGIAQGYHVSRPLEGSAVVPWLLEAQRVHGKPGRSTVKPVDLVTPA